MNKDEIASMLDANHTRFIHQLNGLHDDEFYHTPTGKWNAAQQLDHITKSVAAVTLALSLPGFIIQWKFGKANRASKTYEELIDKYKRKLVEGYVASGRFSAGSIAPGQKKQMLDHLAKLVSRLIRRTHRLSEEALDKYILPHPLLGKLTFREVLYFTAYHVNHHAALVEKGLERYQPL